MSSAMTADTRSYNLTPSLSTVSREIFMVYSLAIVRPTFHVGTVLYGWWGRALGVACAVVSRP